ncbi:MAG: hypothetical protein GX564_06915 [Oligosphaeraceae bacterium]|nr:hypothetical protein [Oligosphaeraceae bacterium]
MNFMINIADGMMIYTLVLISILALLYILERFRQNNCEWELSRSQLMVCKKCGRVFLVKRLERSRQCPECGHAASRFRIPRTGV